MPLHENQEWNDKLVENMKEAFKSPQDWSKIPLQTKSITFDYEAQANLPESVKAKMEADRYNAQVGNKERISKIEKILSDYRKQEDFSDYRLAAYIAKHC